MTPSEESKGRIRPSSIENILWEVLEAVAEPRPLEELRLATKEFAKHCEYATIFRV